MAGLSVNYVCDSNYFRRNVNGHSYITASVNQHIPVYCGSCWIHGTSAAINDRIKVMRKGAFPDVMISRQNLVNCVPVKEWNGNVSDSPSNEDTGGCNGGDPRDILSWMMTNKVCFKGIWQSFGCLHDLWRPHLCA